MGYFHQAILAAAVTFLVIATGYSLLLGLSSTGPNCPGKDPEWIGYCDKAPANPETRRFHGA